MKLKEIAGLLGAKIVCGENRMDMDIQCACGSDMMSEVLAFTKHKAILLTGLNNIHVIRTAEMLDIQCVVFIRGKMPLDEVVELAQEAEIVLLSTDKPMFTACGILYENGIKGGMRK